MARADEVCPGLDIPHLVTVSFDIWGISSVGRARAQHARGLGFDSQILHFEKNYITSALMQI